MFLDETKIMITLFSYPGRLFWAWHLSLGSFWCQNFGLELPQVLICVYLSGSFGVLSPHVSVLMVLLPICFWPYGSLTYMFPSLWFFYRVYLGYQNSSGCSLFIICMFLVRFLILLKEFLSLGLFHRFPCSHLIPFCLIPSVLWSGLALGFLGFIWSAYFRVLIRACLVSRC